MTTNQTATGIAASTAIPTSETLLAALPAGPINPSTLSVLVSATLVLIGATSVTSVRLRIRRGQAGTGAVVADSGLVTVTGAQIVPGTLNAVDSAYDGTGYSLTGIAAGAAATCGPGTLDAQVTAGNL